MAPLYCLMEYSKGRKKGLHFILQHERYCRTRQRSLPHQHRLWEWPYYSSSLSSLWNGSLLKWEQKAQAEERVLNLYFLSHGPLTKYTLERSQFTVGASQTSEHKNTRKSKSFKKNISLSSFSTLTTVTESKEHSLWYCQQRFGS